MCCILSGGNIDPLLLMKVIQHGLKSAGRYLVLRVDMADRPGQLARLSARVADLGLNILDVGHHRSGARTPFDQVEVLLTLEVRSPLHGAEIIAALAADGARVDVVR